MQAFINPQTKQMDVAAFNQWVAFQTKSSLAGGGIVDAKSWLAFARSSRTGGISLNNDALEYTQGLLELSPSRTGTAIKLFGATTSHLTDKTRAAWDKAGLIGKDGNLTNDAAYQNDPYQWVWKTMLPALAKQGITSRQQILSWLSANGQRMTVAGLFADIAVGQTNLQKTKTRFDAQDPNAVDKLQTSDIGRLQTLYAAENNFLIALGKFEQGPGVAILTSLTNALNGMTAWASHNPGLAKALVLTGGGLAMLADAASKVALTIYLGAPLVGGWRRWGACCCPLLLAARWAWRWRSWWRFSMSSRRRWTGSTKTSASPER